MARRIFNRVMLWSLEFLVRRLYRALPDANGRVWSNQQLRPLAPLFSGDVINVSAGNDEDKQGHTYREYFCNADSYWTTNYRPVTEGDGSELILDLTTDVSARQEFVKRFDLVFTHTVLEHIYGIHQAVANLCAMSRDCVVTVVPAMQSYHHDESVYQDYWRFTPFTLVKLFQAHGFATVYVDWNSAPIGNVYLLHVATLHPESWRQKIQMPARILKGSEGPGFWHQRLLSGGMPRNGRLTTLGAVASGK